MNPSLQLAFDEILRKFDEIEARSERRLSDSQAARERCVAAVESRIAIPEQTPAAQFDAVVVADNWGRLFEPLPLLEERVETMNEQLAVVAHIVADNWGGMFEEPARVMEERVYEPVTSDSTSPPSMTVQLTDNAAATEYTSTDPDAPACISPTPTASATTSVSVREYVSVGTSPAEYQRQIQELEKQSPSSPQPAAAEDEADALQQLLEREYKYVRESLATLFLSKGNEAHGLNPCAVPPTPQPPMRLHYPAHSDSSLRRTLDSVFPDEVYNLAAQTPAAHPGPFRSARLSCYLDEHQAAAAGPDSLRAAFLDTVPSLGCVVTTAAGVDHIHLTLCARRGIVVASMGEISVDIADPAIELLINRLRRIATADCCVRAGLWPAQGNTPEAWDPPPLLQLVVPQEETEVLSTLHNRCSMKALILIQSYFWLPSCCRWDAVLHRQHTPWPPPTELRLVSFDAGLRPLPWSSFNMVERSSVTCHLGQFWKPPWYVPIQQTARCVLAELAESSEYLMLICWNFGAIKIYLEMLEHMASVDTVCSSYVVVVDFGEFDDERPAKPEALVAAVHSGDKSHIIHIPVVKMGTVRFGPKVLRTSPKK